MRALICGVSGQDGAFLSKFLLEKGYEVYGTSRDAALNPFINLDKLQITNQITKVSMNISDFRSVLRVTQDIAPDEIYNLAGLTSVGLSYQQPVEAIESIVYGTLNLLEVVRLIDPAIKVYNACSGDCFGNTPCDGATDQTPFKPLSPYAVAKASAYYLVQSYRSAYNLFACSGILFNHESPLRPERFVTQKIVASASRIASGVKERLRLGNLSVSRDWGWAPEYVDAMWRMLQLASPDDFVVSTGISVKLEFFVAKVFQYHGLHWRDHVDIDFSLMRPSDVLYSCGNPEKASKDLNWTATTDLDSLVHKMCQAINF